MVNLGGILVKKIFIITSSIDYTIDYIIEKYSEDVNIYRLNVDLLGNYKINISDTFNVIIECEAWKLNFDDIYAIYYRKPMLPDLKDYYAEYRQMISKDIITLINGLVDSFDKNVLSKPSILRKSENKIFQLIKAKEVGFKIPRSLISNDTKMAINFLRNKEIIKPLTTGKIMKDGQVEIFQTNVISAIEDEISITPIYLQQYEDKLFEVRATIVDKKVYAVKIEPFNKVDWRKDEEKNKYSIIKLPNEIENKCILLMDILDIKFGAFDFIVNKKEEFIFLEVNPNGQWLWLEEELGINISGEIINYLLS